LKHDIIQELLNDIGINTVGDIIVILKHAKKAHHKELKAREDTGKKSILVAPLSINSPTVSTNNEESTWVEPVVPVETVQYTTASYQKQLQASKKTDEIKVGKLRSDSMEFQSAIQEDPMVHEEYTTATYEARLKKKRTTPQSSDVMTKVIKLTPEKSTSSIVTSSSVDDMETKSNRNRRFLEAAGCFRSDNADIAIVKPSVFSRLELPSERGRNDVAKPSNIKSRLGERKASSLSPIHSTKSSRLYSDNTTSYDTASSSVYSRLGPRMNSSSPKDTEEDGCFKPTMIADTISRHSDVHARLRKRGIDMRDGGGGGGPLGKRLGDHAVFTRLE
jgi:hypothetical protein